MTAGLGRLTSKVVVITGGAQGIGRGIAQRCASEGAQVAIADRSPRRDAVAATLACQGASVLALPLDVRVAREHEAVVARVMERFGRIDVLILCAGIFPRATLSETDETLWHAVIDTNLTGVFLACRAIVPQMVAQGNGAIITIGSLHARRGMPDLFAYAVSKGGLVTLTLNVAAALARDGIRVNCVQPGWVMTEGEMAIRGFTTTQAAEFMTEAGERMPLGRMQTPQDIANLVVFLASDEAAQITGQIIAVDGGLEVSWGSSNAMLHVRGQ